MRASSRVRRTSHDGQAPYNCGRSSSKATCRAIAREPHARAYSPSRPTYWYISRVSLIDLPEPCSKSRSSLLMRALVQLCCLVAIGSITGCESLCHYSAIGHVSTLLRSPIPADQTLCSVVGDAVKPLGFPTGYADPASSEICQYGIGGYHDHPFSGKRMDIHVDERSDLIYIYDYFGIAGQPSEFDKTVEDSIGQHLEQTFHAVVQFKMLHPPAQSCLFGP